LPDIHLALAEIYLERGKQAEARQEVEPELAIVPESVTALALKKRLEAAGIRPK
jgi:Tfp pilus assembly protein PilF